MVLHVGWMYPDLLNLHGERGSVQAFERAGENLGVEVRVRRVNDFDETIPFDELDLCLFLPGELKTLSFIKPALERQREALDGYLARGGYIIAVGTTGALFGGRVTREDGSTWDGLGLLEMTSQERRYVWGDDIHFRLTDSKQEIFGSQIQMLDVHAKNPLGQTIYGRGNDGSGAEGARYRNLIYTNCLGPVFVKNPWWTQALVKELCLQKLGIVQKRPNTLESQSFDACLRFTASKPPFDGKVR